MMLLECCFLNAKRTRKISAKTSIFRTPCFDALKQAAKKIAKMQEIVGIFQEKRQKSTE
jgi:fructose 1,6-bisphosphatase